MTVGSIGISSMGGKGVTSGVATAEALFDEARSTAVGRNLRSCVLVAKTLTNKPDEDLRRIIVAYEEANADGTPKNHPLLCQNGCFPLAVRCCPTKRFSARNSAARTTRAAAR
jgi:hypothetical protein